jgi:hypothetical protein
LDLGFGTSVVAGHKAEVSFVQRRSHSGLALLLPAYDD